MIQTKDDISFVSGRFQYGGGLAVTHGSFLERMQIEDMRNCNVIKK